MVKRKALLANQKHQYRASERGEHDCSARNRKNGDYYKYRSLTHFTNEFGLKGKLWKEKLFLQIRSINIMYPNVENKVVVPLMKEMEIITRIHV